MNQLFLQAKPLLDTIERAGYEAYFVGGAVRDHLLGRKISDVDIATSASPEEVKEIFKKTVDVGIEHGTILVIYQGIPYEVTTFRSESGYTDYRRPAKVEFIRSLTEDLQRRDFTMNAIAMDKDFTIIDPYQGREAIQKGIIRTVGEANDRFHEDALRMMRAVRFVSQLTFDIEESTYAGLRKNAYLMEKIAAERILMEFNKLLSGRNKQKAIRLLMDSGLSSFLPGFHGSHEALIAFAELDTGNLTDASENWALLLYLFSLKDEDSFLRSWKMSVKDIKNIKSIGSYLKKRLNAPLRKLELFQAGMQTALSAEKLFMSVKGINESSGLQEVEEAYRSLPIRHTKELAVNGNDLMQWTDRNSGPWIRNALDTALEQVLEQKIENDKNSLRELLANCNLI
ncbi:CCA tRNA nucleotidyltransferase [Peribacillus kribbensis]|uniref:CCA tRNA nucleotidyltransferase n=1 Tax=Peribacillus kribbensis TaxID=356658 RepID=UPI00040846E5|nr:CCA tRNA nucleotidyltransferase [Peribacillus kribbensis]